MSGGGRSAGLGNDPARRHRRVAGTGGVSGRPDRVPEASIGGRGWTPLPGDHLTFPGGRKGLAGYSLDDEPRS